MSQSGLSAISLIIIIALIAILGFLFYQNNQLIQQLNKPTPTPTMVHNSPTPTPEYNIFADKTLKVNYYPVQYSTYTNQQQEVAQTFTLDKDETIQAVTLQASFGVGGAIKLNIYEAGNVTDLTDGKLVGGGSYMASNIIKETPFEVILDKPIQLQANKQYSLVISSSDQKTQTAIEFSENDVIKNGKMYEYSRLVGGNGQILNQKHSWQPINNQDLIYTFKQL